MIALKISRPTFRKCGLFLTLLSAAAAGASAASAQTLTTLASFNFTDGDTPYASLIADGNGNLFGTTVVGGASGYGTVFEIAKTSTGYASAPTTLVSFNGTDGAYPYAGLIVDGNGNLFGTTEVGGTSGDGTVFEIVKTSSGYAGTPTTLVSFNGTDGAYPYAGLIVDGNGNLFGATLQGGTSNNGTVFEIAKTSSGYAATPTTLVSFNGSDGANPAANLIADGNGNLFGTTIQGGAYTYGTVFEIAKTSTGYAGAPTTLVNFNGTDGAIPFAGLIVDGNGNLFGTTRQGGAYTYGTVFEIVKASSGYAGTPTTLVSFNVIDGAIPYGGLLLDGNGNLFGTTTNGGASNDGTVFEIAKTSSGYVSTPTTLVSFNGIDGASPYAGLLADGSGNLFGTTTGGGTSNSGAVFEITNSGFVPLQKAFASFKAQLAIFDDKHPGFALRSIFTPGAGSTGITPATQSVTLQVGSYSVTIPAGSFHQLWQNKNAPYLYEGTINGVRIGAVIAPLWGGRYTFDALASPVDLSGTPNPVTVTLTIGNNNGTTQVNAERSR